MCLRRAPEKYITGAALDRAGLDRSPSLYQPSIFIHRGVFGKMLVTLCLSGNEFSYGAGWRNKLVNLLVCHFEPL
jgi:hypothetical protein